MHNDNPRFPPRTHGRNLEKIVPLLLFLLKTGIGPHFRSRDRGPPPGPRVTADTPVGKGCALRQMSTTEMDQGSCLPRRFGSVSVTDSGAPDSGLEEVQMKAGVCRPTHTHGRVCTQLCAAMHTTTLHCIHMLAHSRAVVASCRPLLRSAMRVVISNWSGTRAMPLPLSCPPVMTIKLMMPYH